MLHLVHKYLSVVPHRWNKDIALTIKKKKDDSVQSVTLHRDTPEHTQHGFTWISAIMKMQYRGVTTEIAQVP